MQERETQFSADKTKNKINHRADSLFRSTQRKEERMGKKIRKDVGKFASQFSDLGKIDILEDNNGKIYYDPEINDLVRQLQPDDGEEEGYKFSPNARSWIDLGGKVVDKINQRRLEIAKDKVIIEKPVPEFAGAGFQGELMEKQEDSVRIIDALKKDSLARSTKTTVGKIK